MEIRTWVTHRILFRLIYGLSKPGSELEADGNISHNRQKVYFLDILPHITTIRSLHFMGFS